MFGEREFTWNKIRQLNRNPLLTMDIGADGLKTGNVDESGYGLVGLRGPERAASHRRRQRPEDRPRPRRRVPQTSGMGIPLVRAASAVRGRTGRWATRRCSAGIGGRCRLSRTGRFVYSFVAGTVSGSRRASSIRARSRLRSRKVPRWPVSRSPEATRRLSKCRFMPARMCEVGTLRQRAFDGLLEVSTGWVRRALSDAFSGI